MPITLIGSSIISGPMSFVAGSGSTPSTPLAWTGAGAASDGFWGVTPISNSITLTFNTNGTITCDRDYVQGPTGWSPYSPSSSYEIQIYCSLISKDGFFPVGGFVGPVGSEVSITNGNYSSWYNLGSAITVGGSGTTYFTMDFSATIREVANTSNSITKAFTIDVAS